MSEFAYSHWHEQHEQFGVSFIFGRTENAGTPGVAEKNHNVISLDGVENLKHERSAEANNEFVTGKGAGHFFAGRSHKVVVL